MPSVSRQERFWIIGWSVVILLMVILPYLYGAWLTTPELQFGGFIIGVEDGNSYLAKMQEGRVGHWLFHLAYTPEPHRAELFFMFYILLGKLSKLLGLALVLVLHLSRIVTVTFGLLSFYYFAAYFTPEILIRRLAFLLFGLTAGLGWLWTLLGLPAELGAMPVDLWVPDASFFLAALTFPHLPLAQGFLLWIVIGSLRFFESGRWPWWAIAAGAGFLVSFIHPYTLPVLVVILGLYLLYQTYRQQWPLGQSLKRLGLIGLPSLPYLIYVLIVFETNFAFQVWREQSLTFSPHPIYYMLGFGLILPLVGIGFWQAGRVSLNHEMVLKIWVLVVPLLIYLPIALQRRFLDGYQSPLALLGAVGLAWLVRRVNIPRLRPFLLALILVPMTLTNLLLVMGSMVMVNSRPAPIFHPVTHHTAFSWLADNAREQTVITAYQTGNLLPAYAPVRVFVGHGPETVHSEVKQNQVRRFFEAGADPFRRELQQTYNLSYLFYGPAERALGDFSPDQAPYLRRVYDNGAVQIYKFTNKSSY